MCQQFHPGTHVGNLEQPFRRRRGLLDHSQSVFYFVPQENKISQSRFLSFVLFPVLRAGRTRKTAAEKNLSWLLGLSSWFLDFSPTIICFRNVSLLQCRAPVFAEKILIWCRRWWKSFVFLPRDVSSQSCQKLPFHVKLLPRGSLSNLMFKLYIVQLRDKYLKMITLLIDQNWLWIKFPRASLISEFLGNIFVGIWAQNWIWSKTFPSSIFCDSPSMDPWPRALCRNKGFFNYSLSQAPKFNLALTFGSRTDEIYRSRALPW